MMRTIRSFAMLLAATALAAGVQAELAPEQGRTVSLPAEPDAHWVLVNDIVFNHMEAGKAFLVDGDSGRMLGMLSTGFGWAIMAIPPDWSALYAPETYYSRHTRGERTDVVTVYDPETLAPVEEIEIPPKRVEGMPTIGVAGLSDDQRFLFVYNFTPAQSVSVVDLRQRALASEIETPGCAFVYPAGPRSFNMICGDASLLTVSVDDAGEPASKRRSRPFFDIERNFITEKAVRHGDTWLYVTNHSDVVPVDVSGSAPRFLENWPLTSEAEKAEGWRIGGVQHSAVHQGRGHLYVLMHRGGEDTHKDPGEEVWVFDLGTRERVARFALEGIASAIQVTQDEAPLLFTSFIAEPRLQVYDATSGEHLRTVEEIGFSPTVLQTPAASGAP